VTPDEMRAKAAETGHTDPIWAVGAEICERLESVLDALMEEVQIEDNEFGDIIPWSTAIGKLRDEEPAE